MDRPDPFCFQLRDEELSKESQESNWFSAPSALRVYGERICMSRMNQGPQSTVQGLLCGMIHGNSLGVQDLRV